MMFSRYRHKAAALAIGAAVFIASAWYWWTFLIEPIVNWVRGWFGW